VVDVSVSVMVMVALGNGLTRLVGVGGYKEYQWGINKHKEIAGLRDS
jgi:hypothetical protein